jgi:hypothetical protein
VGVLVLASAHPKRCAFRFCSVLVFPDYAAPGEPEFVEPLLVREPERQRAEMLRILERLRAGAPQRQVARELGVAPQALTYRLKRWRVRLAPGKLARRFCCERHRNWEHSLEQRDSRALDRDTRPAPTPIPCGFPSCTNMAIPMHEGNNKGYCDVRCRRKASRLRRGTKRAIEDTCVICEEPLDKKHRRMDLTTCSDACRVEKLAIQRRLRAKQRDKAP